MHCDRTSRQTITFFYVLFGICAFLIAGGVDAKETHSLVLAEKGKATCAIVVQKSDRHMFSRSSRRSDTSFNVREQVLPDAAQDLAEHLNEMACLWKSKKPVKVVNDIKQARGRCRILLGSVAVKTHGLEKEAASLPYPAYIYRVIDNDLVIFGSSDKGAANGVYGFLQDELSVRWFGPQDLFRVVEKRETIRIGALNKRVVPSFLGRLYHVTSYAHHPTFTWARRRMRMGEVVDSREPFINTSHALYRIFPVRHYAKTHPEYYAMRGGRRIKPDYAHWIVCLSNPDLAPIAVKAASAFFRAHPRNHCFAIGINDTGMSCECEACRKLNEPVDEFRGSRLWQSNLYYGFVNKVARQVAREFPDRYLGCIAYNNVTPPPRGPVEKNVNVVLVNDISEYFDRQYRQEDYENVLAWEKKDCTLGFYIYLGLAKLVPAYFPHMVAEEFKDKHQRGITNVTAEVNPGWPWTGPMAYVAARLLWDVSLDVDKLLDEYFTTLYGPAAEPMSKLYALFEEIHMRPRRGGFLSEHYKLIQFRPYTGDDLVKMRQYLADAHRAVPDGPIARRVAYVSNGLSVFLEMLEGRTLAQRFRQEAEFNDVSASQRLEEIDRLNAILNRHDALYRETITNDRFQSRRYTNDTCKSVRNAWRAELASAVAHSLVALQKWATKGRVHALVRKRLEQAVADYSTDPKSRALLAVRSGTAKLGPNRIKNPGFEKVTPTGSHPEGPDWGDARADDWSVYPGKLEQGAHDLTEKDVFEGKRAARLVGLKSGSFISTVYPVKPGQLYLFSAYAKCLPPKQGELVSRVFITNLWTKPKGGWWKRSHRVNTELHKVGRWEKLEAIVHVPEGPGGIVLLLSAKNLSAGQEIFFDNVSFRLITTLQTESDTSGH